MRRDVLRFAALAALGMVARAAIAAHVPLETGLTIVTAIAQSGGDYESIKTLDTVDAKSVGMRYSAEYPMDDGIDIETTPYRTCRELSEEHYMCTVRVHRTVLRTDLRTADHYLRIFDPPPGVAELVPGTTAISVSSAVLAGLKSGRPVGFTSYIASFETAPITSADSTEGSIVDPRAAGTLTRIEAGTVPVSVVYNGRLTDLPALHARGELGIDAAEFWILDDPDNPLVLRFHIGSDQLTVIRINSPTGIDLGAGAGDDGLEQALTNKKHVDIYGIYFSFNSDTIRPESEPVLREIATLMTRHPDWKLEVNGHTDNIGGATSNLSLSNRRAAAVQRALSERYHISATRLVPAGFGLSQPKAPNDTLAGRALNRRVELVRE